MALSKLDFIGAVAHLMGRVGEVAVAEIGSTKRGGSGPPILASITGTLTIVNDDFLDPPQEGQPILFGVGDLVLWLDPACFSAAHVRDRYLALRFGEFEVEIHDPQHE